MLQFPSSYLGKYFFADLYSGWIRVFDPTAGTATGFATGISSPVDLHVGPDSALYYLAQGCGGQVFRITALPAQALNISGRARVETGQGVVISGFIVTGTTPKRVGVRALGPSLANFGVSGPLADPILQLNRGDGSLVMVNDNWNTQQAEITAAGLAPPDDREAALLASNDNWQSDAGQAALITGYGLAPPNNLESAIAISLAPAPYTAIRYRQE